MGLDEHDVEQHPIAQFHAWYRDASSEAVMLVTASADAVPSGRMVLLKGADEAGFVFYTNYASAKARDLAANPRAGLVFFWPPDRQVRVNGTVAGVDREESERYWRSRPRASQLSAWASRQSEVVESRRVLKDSATGSAGFALASSVISSASREAWHSIGPITPAYSPLRPFR